MCRGRVLNVELALSKIFAGKKFTEVTALKKLPGQTQIQRRKCQIFRNFTTAAEPHRIGWLHGEQISQKVVIIAGESLFPAVADPVGQRIALQGIQQSQPLA